MRPEDPVGGIRIPARFFHAGPAVLLPCLLDRHVGHICLLLFLVYEKEGKTEKAEGIKQFFDNLHKNNRNNPRIFINPFVLKGIYLVIGN